jgi:hypothetical protein
MKNILYLIALSFGIVVLSSCMKSACHANKKHSVAKHNHYNSIQYRTYKRH